ncbi:MAG TPA: hypothetical protein VEU08_08300, partial [Vicinamibacterales bacterium]|nr:hypothetical protein [Vicinamibacterales bacterium]
MAVDDDVLQRDVPVTFTAQFASYFAGEVAYFHGHEAQALIDRGVAEAVAPPDPPPDPPEEPATRSA